MTAIRQPQVFLFFRRSASHFSQNLVEILVRRLHKTLQLKHCYLYDTTSTPSLSPCKQLRRLMKFCTEPAKVERRLTARPQHLHLGSWRHPFHTAIPTLSLITILWLFKVLGRTRVGCEAARRTRPNSMCDWSIWVCCITLRPATPWSWLHCPRHGAVVNEPGQSAPLDKFIWRKRAIKIVRGGLAERRLLRRGCGGM